MYICIHMGEGVGHGRRFRFESKMDDGGENGGYKGVVDVCESVFARKRV